jgi:hypothetical protein
VMKFTCAFQRNTMTIWQHVSMGHVAQIGHVCGNLKASHIMVNKLHASVCLISILILYFFLGPGLGLSNGCVFCISHPCHKLRPFNFDIYSDNIN